MMKRTLALLLALIMVVGLLPNTLVLAADANDDIYIDESSSLDEISLSEPQDLPDEGSSESGDPAVNVEDIPGDVEMGFGFVSGSMELFIDHGLYRGDITGIAAKDLSGAIYVAAIYSDGTTEWTSGVLGYSIGAYCASQSTKGVTIADLAMATAVYGYHAKHTSANNTKRGNCESGCLVCVLTVDCIMNRLPQTFRGSRKNYFT